MRELFDISHPFGGLISNVDLYCTFLLASTSTTKSSIKPRYNMIKNYNSLSRFFSILLFIRCLVMRMPDQISKALCIYSVIYARLRCSERI